MVAWCFWWFARADFVSPVTSSPTRPAYCATDVVKGRQSKKKNKKPIDIIRHLEDEIAKAEIKLSNFPELKLSEADRCSILLQAVSHPARQYVALHGNANSWSELTKSLKYFEEQLKMCDVPTAANRGMDGKLCDLAASMVMWQRMLVTTA